MLAPARTRYRKQQKGRMRGRSKGGDTLAFGDFGLQAQEPGWVRARAIEAARVAISRAIGRGLKLYIRVFPDKPISKKPTETRMGKGKGNPEEWVAVVRTGRMLYEIEGADSAVALKALRLAAHKLPLPTRIVTRETVL